jgi:hypothetical protein
VLYGHAQWTENFFLYSFLLSFIYPFVLYMATCNSIAYDVHKIWMVCSYVNQKKMRIF